MVLLVILIIAPKIMDMESPLLNILGILKLNKVQTKRLISFTHFQLEEEEETGAKPSSMVLIVQTIK